MLARSSALRQDNISTSSSLGILMRDAMFGNRSCRAGLMCGVDVRGLTDDWSGFGVCSTG